MFGYRVTQLYSRLQVGIFSNTIKLMLERQKYTIYQQEMLLESVKMTLYQQDMPH